MATRNERKRRAKARRIVLLDAAISALEAEAAKTSVAPAPSYPSRDVLPKSDNGFMVERRGSVVKGKFKRASYVEPSKPLRSDGLDDGRGERPRSALGGIRKYR